MKRQSPFARRANGYLRGRAKRLEHGRQRVEQQFDATLTRGTVEAGLHAIGADERLRIATGFGDEYPAMWASLIGGLIAGFVIGGFVGGMSRLQSPPPGQEQRTQDVRSQDGLIQDERDAEDG